MRSSVYFGIVIFVLFWAGSYAQPKGAYSWKEKRAFLQEADSLPQPVFVNIDGVAAVKIGTQTWMQNNLNTDRFRNGDFIPEARSASEWERYGEQGLPAWCYYNNDTSNGSRFGRLYNWYAVNDARGLAPHGWHIPADEEWTLLLNYLGGRWAAGGKMKSLHSWRDLNKGASNSSGFSGLPGGFRYLDGSFNALGDYGGWWSATAKDSTDAWEYSLGAEDARVDRFPSRKTQGFSVRCIK